MRLRGGRASQRFAVGLAEEQRHVAKIATVADCSHHAAIPGLRVRDEGDSDLDEARGDEEHVCAHHSFLEDDVGRKVHVWNQHTRKIGLEGVRPCPEERHGVDQVPKFGGFWGACHQQTPRACSSLKVSIKHISTRPF